ncbi:MAG: TatD family hydrolase, partial [Candidatus Woesearchaeota archaeon]
MILVDIHAHIDFEDYAKDLATLIPKWENAGVKAIINHGVDIQGNRRTLELSKRYKIIQPAFGFYPVHATQISEAKFDEELDWIRKQKPLAIGEVGLDYMKGDDNPFGDEKKQTMKKCFEKFIALAEKKKLPLIAHSRKAELDVVEMLESSKLKKVVMHCFTGRKHLVKRIIDNGWSLSIPCIVVKLQQFQDNVALAPLSQLLTETDCPYLSPYPEIRRNEP